MDILLGAKKTIINKYFKYIINKINIKLSHHQVFLPEDALFYYTFYWNK